ncbi:hypothetical protein QQF64_020515 [Cirrhinus molitorella]|uniref:Uncharacterized protein n=1 Tax=Cirrhinus molitorella TaxID=172907 RepID=A0ABR3LAV7_9TELE
MDGTTTPDENYWMFTTQELRTNLVPGTPPVAEDYCQAEVRILQKVQQESFSDDLKLLETEKPVRSRSRLVTLAPEMDPSSGLIRVGGRLRRVSGIKDSILILWYWILVTLSLV